MMDSLRVLVADDELGMRLSVARALRDLHITVPPVDRAFGFIVDQAESGEQALQMIRDTPPDLLLLDHKLPGMSGLDVLEAMNGAGHDLLTIMITAYASIETAVTATKLGAFDFLSKPFTPAELKSSIRKAAGQLVLMRQARELEAEKRRVRFEFIRVLGHELKAPLNAVGGYLQIMAADAAGDDPATRKQMVDRSLIRIEHMRKLIQDLLDMTRIEAGERRRDLKQIDVVEIARHAIETMTPDAAARDITIQYHGPGDLPMQGDATELEIVLNNLISNAVKYNREGGKVDVTVGGDDERIMLRVADTGIGMSEEEAARLFNDFVRIRNDKTRNILGSGLGLSILRKIADLYGGHVAVTSAPDQGSTFTVELLRQTQENVRDTQPHPHSAMAEGN
jgi:two-component system sensor histidine kinase/response regulator